MEDEMYPNACYFSKRFCVYKATLAKNNLDTSMYWQASSGDEAEYWFEAMNNEIDNLTNHNMWELHYSQDNASKLWYKKLKSGLEA
eukprot:114040-Ditylum_brightwellii.AAC.1